MRKLTSILFLLFFTMNISKAQKRSISVSAGPLLLIPTIPEINCVGFGFGVGVDYKLNNKFSLASSVDVNVLNSEVKIFFNNKTVDGFTLMPVLIGVKWVPVNNIYFAGKVDWC